MPVDGLLWPSKCLWSPLPRSLSSRNTQRPFGQPAIQGHSSVLLALSKSTIAKPRATASSNSAN